MFGVLLTHNQASAKMGFVMAFIEETVKAGQETAEFILQFMPMSMVRLFSNLIVFICATEKCLVLEIDILQFQFPKIDVCSMYVGHTNDEVPARRIQFRIGFEYV